MTLTLEQWVNREVARVNDEWLRNPFSDCLVIRDDEPDNYGPPTLEDAQWFQKQFERDMEEREHTQ